MKESKYYRKKIKKDDDKNYIWITKLLLSIIICLVCLIITNFNVELRNNFKKNFLEESINFVGFNKFYKKYIGSENIVNKDKDDTEVVVVNNEIEFNNLDRIEVDGSYKIKVGDYYPVSFLESGLIVYIGDKDNYKNTVIIQGNDGVDIWYTNVKLNDYSLYDYVKKGDILGESLSDEIIVTIMKDGKKLNYEDYFK